MTVAFSQEKMSSGGVQLSLGVSTLSHNALQLADPTATASHCPSSPGPRLTSSLLFQSQQDALSTACPNLRTAVFLSLPATHRAVSVFHTDRAGKPLHPPSTGNSPACHPLSLHCSTRSWYLEASLLYGSSHPSSHGTVNSIGMIFFDSYDHKTKSGLSDVCTNWGKTSLLPRSALISHVCAAWRGPVLIFLGVGGFCPSLTNCISLVGLPLFQPLPLQCKEGLVVTPSVSSLAKSSLASRQYVRHGSSPSTQPTQWVLTLSPICVGLLVMKRCRTLFGAGTRCERVPVCRV